MRIMFLLASILFLISVDSYSQVNTEQFKFHQDSKKLYGETSLDIDWEDGNSRDTEYTAGIGIAYSTSFLHNYLIGYLQYKEGQGTIYKNKGHLYIASEVLLSKIVNPEFFLQKNFHEFIKLKDRYLAGVHARTNILDIKSVSDSSSIFIINLAPGVMWEYELIDADPQYDTKLWRSTNYFNIYWKLHEKMSLYTTTYYQVAFEDLNDYRLLNDFIMEFSITDNLFLSINLHYRYDNEPPPGLLDHDIEIIQGIKYKFSIY
ncbi:DUF481 domain-containing protein [Bacteroidota bacterium]